MPEENTQSTEGNGKTHKKYTVAEVAEIYGKTESTVYRWIDEGKLRATYEKTTIYITQAELDSFSPPKMGRPKKPRDSK